MTDRAALFALIRRIAGRGLRQPEVDEINAVLNSDKPAATVATAIKEAGINGKAGTLTAIVGAVAATSLLATVPKHEGLEYKAYRDIVGVVTICYGDTKNVRMGMVETPEGCQRRLEAQLVAHAKPVMDCTPTLAEPGRDWQRAAAVSLAYNIGVGAWCRSTADKLFDRRDWRGGCDAFLRWNKAGGRVVRGLSNRRAEEKALCLKGLT